MNQSLMGHSQGPCQNKNTKGPCYGWRVGLDTDPDGSARRYFCAGNVFGILDTV